MYVFSINISTQKGQKKAPVQESFLRKDWGLEGDAHAGGGPRQLSLLAWESIDEKNAQLKAQQANFILRPGDFAENITTRGLHLPDLRIGDRLLVGDVAILEISQRGKVCHDKCEVYYRTGDCIMPRACVFAIVKKSGVIQQNCRIQRL